MRIAQQGRHIFETGFAINGSHLDLLDRVLAESAYAFELRGLRRRQAWENVKKLRGLVRRIQNRGYATLRRIADYLMSMTTGDEANAIVEALDAVNLMTVHASKGSSFPSSLFRSLKRCPT
jgi:superfamily I DNA/RNA helicase